jgi:CopG family nickel-responsive transcriptional regulator
VVRFSVSINPDLLQEFDETTSRLGYNRSSAIQVAMRVFFTEHMWKGEQEGMMAGAITMVYDHNVRGLMETLTDVQHNHLEVISSTTHVHLDEHNCLEIIAFKGDIKTIRSLAEKLMTTRGVKQLKVATLMI